jgi:predicted PurR-regulated permease PerM
MRDSQITDDVARSKNDPLSEPDVSQETVNGLNRFGPLGERFDRHSPFWIGMSGGLGLAAAYVVWTAVSSSREVLLFIALAFVIAIGLDPVVGVLCRLAAPRWLGVVIVLLAVLSVVGLFLALAIPPLVNETNRLINLAPHYARSLQRKSSLLAPLNRQYRVVRD